jgi:hypothetical protein
MMRDLSEGLAAVSSFEYNTTVFGLVNKSGTMVVRSHKCLETGPFVAGLVASAKSLGADGDRDGLSWIDRAGRVIWQERQRSACRHAVHSITSA